MLQPNNMLKLIKKSELKTLSLKKTRHKAQKTKEDYQKE